MSEQRQDSSDRPFLSRRLIAAQEIAAAERARSEAHEQNSDKPSATLAWIEMGGLWSAANDFERELITQMATLFDSGYDTMRKINRTAPDAKITVSIPAGLTNEMGFVALRRKRKFMTVTSPSEPPFEVDKISMFALDIPLLASVSTAAVDEVRLIVASTMYQAIDPRALGRDASGIGPEDKEEFEYFSQAAGQSEDAFLLALEQAKHLMTVLRRYDITLDELEARLATPNPTYLHSAESAAFVEEALKTRSELLTPAATTYYAHSSL